ncbi:hypothetical protein DCC39_17285 [Pueribacillus theae]|uniref:Uncharacterized protein n=1 Tax=Pueribacillus theae TaxID=2171751 RepID=A0A2U1JND8_9BACI|nr:hypothetical protein [Pueribacillus theae]PWA06686.1 hypothetical protein DCC39_17285 [Pueribacillus theae]
METLSFILIIIALPNLLYGLLFVISFNGIKRIFESMVEDDFTIIVTIAAFLFFGPSYFLAAYFYGKNGFLARIIMLLYSFALFMFIGFLL